MYQSPENNHLRERVACVFSGRPNLGGENYIQVGLIFMDAAKVGRSCLRYCILMSSLLHNLLNQFIKLIAIFVD